MAADRINADQVFTGDVKFTGTVTLPTNLTLPATTVRHQFHRGWSQPNTTATAETRTIHVVQGATATVKGFQAGSIVACIGAATVTVDLKKNGVSILSAVITLDSANTARIVEAGALSSSTLVVGDWLEAVITATVSSGTLATGVYCDLEIEEDALA